MTFSDAYKEALDMLKNAGFDEYDSDVSLLFQYVTGIDRNGLFIKSKDIIDDSTYAKLKDVLNKRLTHIPVQHITNNQCFMGYDFFVNENVLVPRFDTEILVDAVLKALKKVSATNLDVLDICTGSGCIIISLILMNNMINGTATDISEKALEVANVNKEKLGVNNLKLINTDLVNGINEKYDVIVSNPPYIETKVIETLTEEVKNHDPMLALDGGDDGLIFYRRLADEAIPLLKDDGFMAVEIGYNQGTAVKELFEKAGLNNVEVIKDYAHLDRVVIGYK